MAAPLIWGIWGSPPEGQREGHREAYKPDTISANNCIFLLRLLCKSRGWTVQGSDGSLASGEPDIFYFLESGSRNGEFYMDPEQRTARSLLNFAARARKDFLHPRMCREYSQLPGIVTGLVKVRESVAPAAYAAWAPRPGCGL